MSDAEADAASERCALHFQSVKDLLPAAVVELYETGALHDGKLLELGTDTKGGKAHLVVDAWDTFGGNVPVLHRLDFEGVVALDIHASYKYEGSMTKAFGDLGYIEADVVTGGLFQMDFLFWSAIELGITFRSLCHEAQGRRSA